MRSGIGDGGNDSINDGTDEGMVVTFDFGNAGGRVYTGLGRWNSDHTEFLLDEDPHLVSDWPSCAPDLTSTPLALTFKDHEPKAWGQSALQYIHNKAYHVEPHPKKKFAELAREKPDKGLRDIMAGMKHLWEHILQHVLEYAGNYYELSVRPTIRQVGIGVPSGWHASLVQLFLKTAPNFDCPIIVRTETSAILQSYLHGLKPKVGQVYVIADHGSSTQNFGLSEVVQVDPLITRELASGGSTIGACTLEDILRKRVVEQVGAAASPLREEIDQIIDRFLALEFERLKFLADNDDLVEQTIDVKPEPFTVTKSFMDEIREELFTQMNEPWTEFLSQCQDMVAERGKKIELVVVSGGISGSKGLQNFLKKTHPDIPLVFPKRIKTEDVARGLMFLALRPLSCSRDTVGRHYGIGSDEKYDPEFHKEGDKLKRKGDPKLSDDEETYNIPEGGQPLAKTVRWVIFPDSKTTETFSFPMSLDFDEDINTICVDVFTRPPKFSESNHIRKSPRSEAEKVTTYALNFERELQEVAKRREEQDKPCDKLPYYVLLKPEGEDIKVSVVWDLNGTDMELEKLLSSDFKCEKSCKVHRAISADEVSKRKRGSEDMESNKRLKISEPIGDTTTGDPGSEQFPANASARNSSELGSTPSASTSERPPGIASQRTPLPTLLESHPSIPASKINGGKTYRTYARKPMPRKATQPPPRQKSRPRNVSVFEGLYSWTSKTPITLEFSKKEIQAIHSKKEKVYRQIRWRDTESIWRLPAQSNPDAHVYFLFSSSDCSKSFVITNHSTETKPRGIADTKDIDRRTELDLMFDKHLSCHRKHVLIPGSEPLYIRACNGPTEGVLIFLQRPGIHDDTIERNVMMWGLRSPLYLPVDTLHYPMGLKRKPDRSIDLHVIDVRDVEGRDHRFTDLQCDDNQLKMLRSHLGVEDSEGGSNVSERSSTFLAEAVGKAKIVEQEAEKAMGKAKMLKRKKERRRLTGKCGRHQDREPIMAEKIKRSARITSDNKGFEDESTNVASSREELVGWSGELLAGDFDSEDDSYDDEFHLADYSDCEDD